MIRFFDSQEYVAKMLMNSFKKNRLSHSYLFVGDRGTPKYEMAKELAKLILCENEACNSCPVCQRIDNDNHTNVFIINPDEQTIKKEQILELQTEFSKTALEKGAKVYIINDADKMNDSASNSLLKFLEEPHSDIYGILITNNIDKILPTIISRSQTLNFKGNEKQVLLDDLRENGFDDITSLLLVSLTNSLTEAIKMGEDENIRKIIDKTFEMFSIIREKSLLLNYHLNFDMDKQLKVLWFNILVEYFRDVLNFQVIGKIETFVSEKKSIEKLASNMSQESIIKVIDLLLEVISRADYNVNEELLMDSTLLQLEEILNEGR